MRLERDMVKASPTYPTGISTMATMPMERGRDRYESLVIFACIIPYVYN